MPQPDRLQANSHFALRYVHDARLSPDGARIAYVLSRTDEANDAEFFEILIEDLGSRERRTLPFVGRATFPRWSPSGGQIAFIGTNAEGTRLYLCDLAHPSAPCSLLTPHHLYIEGPFDWSRDGSQLVFTVRTTQTQDKSQTYYRIKNRIFRSEGLGVIDRLEYRLHLLDIASRDIKPVSLPLPVSMLPSFSPCGKRLLFMGSDSAVGFPTLGGLQLYTVELADGQVKQLLDECWYVAAAAWHPSGDRIVVAGHFNSPLPLPMAHLWVIDRDGANPVCRTQGLIGNVGLRMHHDMPTWETSQNNIFCVPHADFALATVLTRGNAHIFHIALDGPVDCQPLVTGERTCVLFDADPTHDRITYAASDLHRPWELYVADLDGSQEKRLTHLNDDILAAWPRLESKHLIFQSADGLPLEGWFLSRADYTGPQPTVLFIHGGPMLSVGNMFRFDFHLLASNGYAVVFANFRGSSGYGDAFMHAITGDWGARGFPDHMATVDAAVAQGLADPQRLGIWGSSHGGFATCWAVGHTHRFRAAVAESASTNFASFYYICDAPDMFAKDLGGRPDQIPDVYRSRSPLTYAHRCKTPTLMLHGEEDLRCPIIEAEQFYRALHDAGCATEFVRIPRMTHMGDCVGPLPVRRAQNEALLDWFERFL